MGSELCMPAACGSETTMPALATALMSVSVAICDNGFSEIAPKRARPQTHTSRLQFTLCKGCISTCLKLLFMARYARLIEPELPPPSREYIEAYCRAQSLARPPTTDATHSGARPPGAPSAVTASADHQHRRGPRIFDAGPGDAADYASFCAALAHHRELRGLRDADELHRRTTLARMLSLTLSALALSQGVSASVFGYTLWVDLGDDPAAQLTCAIVFGSGCLGLVGGVWRLTWALQSFFMTQIWALAFVFAQWLRSQQRSGRTSLFCQQYAAGKCAAGTDATQLGAIILSLMLVYASMFVSDVLAERLQNDLEREDQVSLIRLSWHMHRKTLAGVQRFEDLIHSKFEELVGMGYLKAAREGARRAAASE